MRTSPDDLHYKEKQHKHHLSRQFLGIYKSTLSGATRCQYKNIKLHQLRELSSFLDNEENSSILKFKPLPRYHVRQCHVYWQRSANGSLKKVQKIKKNHTLRIRVINDVPFNDNARSADSLCKNSTQADLYDSRKGLIEFSTSLQEIYKYF